MPHFYSLSSYSLVSKYHTVTAAEAQQMTANARIFNDAMQINDTVVSIDPGPDDCLYRILRQDRARKRIIYATLKDLDLLPPPSQTYGPRVIFELSKVDNWFNDWDTITISRGEDDALDGEVNTFSPHALPDEYISQRLAKFNLLDFRVSWDIDTRVRRVQVGDVYGFLKIARFQYELEWLANELAAYAKIAGLGSPLAPRVIGYAYEETPERVIGFISEEVVGRCPDVADLAACQAALDDLHELGIIHGALHKKNMVVTATGVKFINLEDSTVCPVGSEEDWARKKEEEMRSMTADILGEEDGSQTLSPDGDIVS